MTTPKAYEYDPGLKDREPSAEYATPEYKDLISEIDDRLLPNHEITYIPFKPEQALEESTHITYAETGDLPRLMADTDAIICISRDEDMNPDYTDQYPNRNIVLTPSGRANVDKSVELFKLAQAAGNTDIKWIATGRMHNRAVRMMLAMPVFAEFIGVNAEDVYHIPEAQFKALLDKAFTPENIADLNIGTNDDEELGSSYKAVRAIFNDEEYNASLPTEASSTEELQKAAEAIFQEYRKYPRVSTSRLMVERAVELGVPREAIFEEDGAVDTISNLVFVTEMLEGDDSLREASIKNVAIVAGSDHLPRTAWLADHILPDTMSITCIESNPSLNADDYAVSCTRELNSFRKGSKWIGDTRDTKELRQIVETGYFSAKRVDAAELARQVALSKTLAEKSITKTFQK